MAPRSHLFQGYRWFSAFMVYIVLSLASIDSVFVTVETPWLEETKSQIVFKSIERFNGLEKKDYPQYKTDFTTGLYTGVYYQLSAAPAGFYGGAQGVGFYAYNQVTVSLELKINKTEKTQDTPLNYFGLLVSALKKKDRLAFFYQKHNIFDFSLELIYNKLYGQGDYWYNQHFASATRAYAFVFINFFFDDGEYDEVHFASQNDWFCSDNHSVGGMSLLGAISGTEVYRGNLTLKHPPKPIPPPTEPSPPPTEPSPPTPETIPPTPEPSLPTPETIPTRVEPPKVEPSLPKAESKIKRAQANGIAARPTPTPSSSTTTKAELIPFICMAWITVDVILATVALE